MRLGAVVSGLVAVAGLAGCGSAADVVVGPGTRPAPVPVEADDGYVLHPRQGCDGWATAACGQGRATLSAPPVARRAVPARTAPAAAAEAGRLHWEPIR